MRKALLSLVVLALAAPAFADNKVVKPGDKAPTFSGIPAIAPNGEQTSLSLPDLKEDVVVLVFLANHCPAVQACDDRIIDFANDYKDKPVKLVAVCVNDMDSDRLPKIKEHMKDKGINYVYGYDESQAIGRAYGAVVTPHFFVLDKARLPLRTLSDFIQNQRLPTPPSSNTSSSSLSSTSTTQTSTTTTPNTSQQDFKMAFGTRRRNQTVTRETKPTLMTRLRGRNANSRTVKTTTTVHPNHTTAGHTTGHTTARRSRWGGRNTRTAQPVVHHRRHASIGDKISGAMLKLKGSLTHRPGVKAAGTRRMHGTDGRGSHRVY
jgi:peroxiredoxin